MARQIDLPFPWMPLLISVVLAAMGVLAYRTKRRRRFDASDPRCLRCGYSLIGLTSPRCPECGSDIAELNALEQRKTGWWLTKTIGCIFVVWGMVLPIEPVVEWARSVRWYRYHSTASILVDLKNGFGVPPPRNYPQPFWRHGWLGEEVDLSRVALEELKSRELSPAERLEMDRIALAEQVHPMTTAGQFFLSGYLGERMSAGLLTPEHRDKLIANSLKLNLKARPIVYQGDIVPIQIDYTSREPVGLMNRIKLKSLVLDGKEVAASTVGMREPVAVWSGHGLKHLVIDDQSIFKHAINCDLLGHHTIRAAIAAELKICGNSAVICSRDEVLDASFEIRPSTAPKIKSIADKTAIPLFKMDCIDYVPAYSAVSLRFTVAQHTTNLACDIFVRFDGHEYPVGKLVQSASAAVSQKWPPRADYTGPPLPQNVDVVFRSNPELALTTVDQFEICGGEIVIQNVRVNKQ